MVMHKRNPLGLTYKDYLNNKESSIMTFDEC